MARQHDDDESQESLPVTADTPLEKGDILWVEWANSWYKAVVVALGPNDQVKIHYVGWDDTYDELVDRSRLRLGSPPQGEENDDEDYEEGEFGSLGKEEGTKGPVYQNMVDGLIHTQPLTDVESVQPGDQLLVLWGESWWTGSVVENVGDGLIKIHYEGWNDSWDEKVPPSRLRLPCTGSRQAIVYLDRDWKVTGLLKAISQEYLILQLEDSGKELVISRERIIYFEIIS